MAAREDVENGDIQPTLDVLSAVLTSPTQARRAMGAVDLAIHGYDHTPTELFEMDLVRSFVRHLDEAFPYWLFFSSLHSASLQMIALCFLPPFLTDEGKRQHFGPRLNDLLLKRWIPALNQMAEYVGLTDTELRDRSDAAIDYFTLGPAVSTKGSPQWNQ
ncbi:hypothetical protein [Nocardia shimofusensis]|uniref:hypothetical protein n=1 Tax=Nocardia shimofusensis TaxID=228596 RepID=UPI0012EEC418|nr:hypothetical protein [Nocardia shimofusensis]